MWFMVSIYIYNITILNVVYKPTFTSPFFLAPSLWRSCVSCLQPDPLLVHPSDVGAEVHPLTVQETQWTWMACDRGTTIHRLAEWVMICGEK